MGALIGAAGGAGFYYAAPATATFLGPISEGAVVGFSSFSATMTAYTITGAAAGGAIGYGSGFTGGMLYSDGDWGYSHQSGMFGAQIGATVGSALGAAAGLLTPEGRDWIVGMFAAPPTIEVPLGKSHSVDIADNNLSSWNKNQNNNGRILYKNKNISFQHFDLGYKFTDGIGIQASTGVMGNISYDGNYVRAQAMVLKNQTHLNLFYGSNIVLRDNKGILDVFYLGKHGDYVVPEFYQFIGNTTFSIPKDKLAYFLDFQIYFWNNFHKISGELFKRTFLIIP